MAEGTEGAEATPAGDAGAEATPTGTEGASAPAEAGGESAEPRQGSHFSDGYGDEDVRKQAQRYNSEEDRAKALRSANSELSTRLKIPGEDADEATVSAYRKQIGIPDTIDGYKVARPEHVPEPMWESEQVQTPLTAMVTRMHDAGASKKVVDSVLEGYWQMALDGDTQMAGRDKENMAQAESALRKKWDTNYEANIGHAKEAARLHPDLAQLELKDGSLVGYSPYFAEMMSTYGRQNSEGGVQAGFVNSEAGVDMKSRYDELGGQINDAYNAGDKMKADRLDAERRKLSVRLHGDRPINQG